MTEPSAACARCGDFAPLTQMGGRGLCAACVPRRHPILAEPPSGGLYLRWSFELLRTMGVPAGAFSALAMGLFAAAGIAIQMVAGIVPGRTDVRSIVVGVAMTLLSIPVYAYVGGFVTALGAQAIDGRVDVGDALRAASLRLPSLVGVSVGAGLAILAGLMCCCVPGFVLGFLFALPVPAVIIHRCGPIEAIRRSVAVVRGVVGPLTAALGMTSLVWIVGSVVVQIPTLAFMFERAFDEGPEAMLAMVERPPMWFHGATVLQAMVGSLFLLPLLNTATVVYLNRTEGAHAPREAASPSAAPLSDAGR